MDNLHFDVCVMKLRSQRWVVLDRREHWVSVIKRGIKPQSQPEGWETNAADVCIRSVGISCNRRRWLGLVYSDVLDSVATLVSVAKEIGKVGRSC